MEVNAEVFKVLEEIEQQISNRVCNKYVEIVNGIHDGVNDVLRIARTDAATFNYCISTAITEAKEKLSSIFPTKLIDRNKTSAPPQPYFNRQFNNFESTSRDNVHLENSPASHRRYPQNEDEFPQLLEGTHQSSNDSQYRFVQERQNTNVESFSHRTKRRQTTLEDNEKDKDNAYESKLTLIKIDKLPNGLKIRNYVCKICEYSSTYNSNLHRHIRTHHKKADGTFEDGVKLEKE